MKIEEAIKTLGLGIKFAGASKIEQHRLDLGRDAERAVLEYY